MGSIGNNIDHPCFNHTVCASRARIHLPVAPDCNIQCNFCNRVYDCVNESRPGVTSKILTPHEAYEKYIEVKKRMDNIAIVGFAGPGDPMANFEEVKETVNLIKKTDKDMKFCLSTNGLVILDHLEEIMETGFSYVTVTINAVNSGTGSKIYDYVNYKGKVYTGEPAAEILLRKQWEGLSQLVYRGVVCKINTVYLKGINDFEIEEIAKLASQKGAYIMNIKNLIPIKGTKFENLESASLSEMNDIRNVCSKYIKQMAHCKQCRADSVGLLGEDRFKEFY